MATQKANETGHVTSVTKSAPKRSTTKAAVKKPVAAAKHGSAAKPGAAAELPPTGELSKKELLDRLVAESGMKKSEARTALNALLSVMHGAFSEGKSISAAPLGKIKLTRRKQTPNGELAVLRVKLRSPDDKGQKEPGADPVADSREER
jgi:DNA-binding protein HU-alpha